MYKNIKTEYDSIIMKKHKNIRNMHLYIFPELNNIYINDGYISLIKLKDNYEESFINYIK